MNGSIIDRFEVFVQEGEKSEIFLYKTEVLTGTMVPSGYILMQNIVFSKISGIVALSGECRQNATSGYVTAVEFRLNGVVVYTYGINFVANSWTPFSFTLSIKAGDILGIYYKNLHPSADSSGSLRNIKIMGDRIAPNAPLINRFAPFVSSEGASQTIVDEPEIKSLAMQPTAGWRTLVKDLGVFTVEGSILIQGEISPSAGIMGGLLLDIDVNGVTVFTTTAVLTTFVPFNAPIRVRPGDIVNIYFRNGGTNSYSGRIKSLRVGYREVNEEVFSHG